MLPPLPPMVCACDRPAVSSNGLATRMPTVKARSDGGISGLLVRAPTRRLVGLDGFISLLTRCSLSARLKLRVLQVLGLKHADDQL